MVDKLRALTGSRPTGAAHIGNYFGAFRQIIDLQKDYETFFFMADFHAFNENPSKDQLFHNTLNLAATIIAAGFDVENHCIFAQSAVPQTTELAWILSCQAPFGLLTRAVAFKDAQAKSQEVNCGVFNYPILMAADILLYDADVVPVGKDQSQHIEIARDLGQRFNFHYGDTFRIPKGIIKSEVSLVPGLDGEKMSSSKGNVIPIFASDKEWKKQVMAITSDSKGLDEPKDPETCIIYHLYKLLASEQEQGEMAESLRKGGYGYGHAKLALLEKIQRTFTPMRDRYDLLMKHPDDLRDIIRQGSRRARLLAEAKLDFIQKQSGFIGRPFS